MKTQFVILIVSLVFSFSATAQNNTVERTKRRAKQKTNNRIDRKIDQKLDEGLDGIENLFRKKKKKKSKNQNNNSSEQNAENQNTNTEQNDGMGVLSQMFGGGDIEVKDVYNFDTNFIMRMQSYKKNGKKDGDTYIRYFNSPDPNIMAMEVMEANKEGQPKSADTKIIIDGEQRAMVTIIEKEKQAMAMKMPNVEDYENLQEQEENQEEAMKDVKVTRTGKTKTILGYKCYETIMESEEMRAVSWTTKEVKLSQFKAFGAIFLQKKKDQQQLMAMPMEFIMEMTSTDKKTGEKTRIVVTEINENQNSDVVMSNYQLINMSGLMNSGQN